MYDVHTSVLRQTDKGANQTLRKKSIGAGYSRKQAYLFGELANRRRFH